MNSFVDLFSGLGGFRLGLEANQMTCLLSSDINSHASQVYELNFGEPSLGDVTEIDPKALEDFTILCGGFPCQPFSRAGRMLGFEDTRGTLFFDICRILKEKKPEVVFLENVRNLSTHDGGQTLKVIVAALEDIGYTVATKVLNAADFGVPQNRERIIIVGSLTSSVFNFDSIPAQPRVRIKDVLESGADDLFEWLDDSEFTLLNSADVVTQKRSGLRFVGYRNKNFRIAGVNMDNLHHSRTHKQPNRIYSDEGTHPTLSAGEKSGRYFIHTQKQDGKYGVRKLTIAEGLKIFGYPDDYKMVGPVGEQWSRIGNSICVPMVAAIGAEIKSQLLSSRMPEK